MIDDTADLPADLTEDGPRERRYSAPALEKGLDILEYLSLVRDGLSLQQVAEGVGRTKGEIFRMVSVLEERGYIERSDGDDRYVVTDKLFRLGLHRPIYRALVGTALPVMHAFAEETGYSVHLAVVSGAQMVVVARVESTSHIGFSVRIGYRQPLNLTGSGHCLLTFMSLRRRLQAFQALRTEDPWVDLDGLERKLEGFRAAGRVIRPSGIAEAVTDLSCPILDPQEGGAIAALTSPYIRMRTNPIEIDVLGDRLAEAAARISTGLGKGEEQ